MLRFRESRVEILGEQGLVFGNGQSQYDAGAAQRPMIGNQRRGLLRRIDTRRHPFAAGSHIESRDFVHAVANDWHALRLEDLQSSGDVENILGPGTDHSDRRAGQFQQVG